MASPPAPAQRCTHRLIGVNYPARIVGYLIMAAMAATLVLERGRDPALIGFGIWLMLFPHLARGWAGFARDQRRSELWVMQADSGNAAILAGVLGFAMFPTAVLVFAMVMNALIVGGPRFGLRQVPWLGLGALLGWALNGFQTQWQSGYAESVLATVGLACHAILAGSNAWRAQLALRAARATAIDSSRDAEKAMRSDALTGARTRRHMGEHLDRLQPAADAPVGLLLLDIDHFKQINDRFGHAAGDEVLIQFVQRLARAFPPPFELARWGGEEFLLLAPGTPASQLAALAESVRALISVQHFNVRDGITLKITTSVGAAPLPFGDAPSSQDWTRVLELADQALYKAKHAGRNTWVCVQPQVGQIGPQEVLRLGLANADRSGLISLERPPRLTDI